MVRHGQQWIEKRHGERREEMQRLLVLWQSRSTGASISPNVSVTEDIIHLFKQVARTIHYCFTPLLFLPKWRLQVARTRDPNLATLPNSSLQAHTPSQDKYFIIIIIIVCCCIVVCLCNFICVITVE